MSSSNSSNRSPSPTGSQEQDPGAYPIPFSTGSVELGSRLDSITASLRYWAVDAKRAHTRWYTEMVEANNRYEEWLSTRPPGEYPMPFGKGRRMDETEDSLRYWGIHPDRSSSPWYNDFVRANARYEQHLGATRTPGKFLLPRGASYKYAGMPIEDVPQDDIWWALRPSNCHKDWYQPLNDANKRFLDDVYKSRSPGSEPIWFGKRYRGLRLDQVYQRRNYIRWCFDPQRRESGWLCRLKDLVLRLEAWRLAHPERSRPRRQRKAPNVQNPVGEAIGPWDDSPGSADEDEYEKDGFIQSDSDELEYSSGSDGERMDDGDADNDVSRDSEESTSSSAEMTPSVRHAHKRKRTNVVLSGDEESQEANTSAGKLGRRYRVQHGSSEE